MASRRSRPTSAAAEQLIGKLHQQLPPVGARQYRLLFERRAEFRETLAGLPLLDGLRDWA
jgi:hypothetical protein